MSSCSQRFRKHGRFALHPLWHPVEISYRQQHVFCKHPMLIEYAQHCSIGTVIPRHCGVMRIIRQRVVAHPAIFEREGIAASQINVAADSSIRPPLFHCCISLNVQSDHSAYESVTQQRWQSAPLSRIVSCPAACKHTNQQSTKECGSIYIYNEVLIKLKDVFAKTIC